MHIVQGRQLCHHQGGIDQHVHPSAAHFFKGLAAAASVENFDFHPKLRRNLVEQIGVGAGGL
ncbi:hypothetical protein D3C75_1278770 [compost metagenome]